MPTHDTSSAKRAHLRVQQKVNSITALRALEGVRERERERERERRDGYTKK